MKNLILAGLFLIPGASFAIEGKPMSDADLAMFNACEAFHAYQVSQPACDAIVAESKHHLVDESEYRSWCGTASQAQESIKKYAAEYKKLAGKRIDVSRCQKEN